MAQKYYSAEKNIQVVVSLLKQYGISRVIASPGTTNLTFVACLQHDPFFTVYSAPEERSAAYMAVGMAEESGEPVVITCTGATASRNYLPGLTEAFYRKLPVLAITATQPRNIVGQLVPQVIDRSVQPADTVNYSVHIPVVKDNTDYTFAVLKTNEALHNLRKRGGGPVHINLETTYSQDFSVEKLPEALKIGYYTYGDTYPEIPNGKVGIFVGSHSAMSDELTELIDAFCDKYGAVVFCDHTSNYKGKNRFQYPLVKAQDNWHSSASALDLMIHIGGVSGAYAQPTAKNIWRINPDGIIRSVYGLPKVVFELSESEFFRTYSLAQTSNAHHSYIEQCYKEYSEIYSLIPEDLPFSNIWMAKNAAPVLPENSVIHFGILNSLRSWNFFEIPLSVNSYCNVGGFGIDGPMSTLIGGALAQPDKIHYLIVGDLAFFYDLNALGNRHLPANLRILLVNNGRGTEFTNYNHPASKFGKDADKYFAAAGHYGNQSPDLVRHYAEDLGFEYKVVNDKTQFADVLPSFVNAANRAKPILIEAFTDSTLEDKALHIMRNLKTDGKSVLEGKVRNLIGRKGVESVKKILGK